MNMADAQELVARSMISTNHLLRSSETYTFLWYLTLVSANKALRNSGQIDLAIYGTVLQANPLIDCCDAFHSTRPTLYIFNICS